MKPEAITAADDNAVNQPARRSSKKWTAFVLVLIAAGFFFGVIINRWYVG